MAITTSYFANLKHITNPLSICCRPPVWYKGNSYLELSPHPLSVFGYKGGKITKEEFTVEYQELILDGLNAKRVYKYLTNTYGKDVTLICYERPGDFCHRRLAADWFTSKLGIEVLELPNTVNIKSRHIPAKTLF